MQDQFGIQADGAPMFSVMLNVAPATIAVEGKLTVTDVPFALRRARSADPFKVTLAVFALVPEGVARLTLCSVRVP